MYYQYSSQVSILDSLDIFSQWINFHICVNLSICKYKVFHITD